MNQNSSLKSVRPINFQHNTTNAQIYEFVNNNRSQALSVNAPTMPFKTAPSFYPQTSLFDRYNRLNVYLRDCDRRDLILLTKNVVIHQESLSENLAQEIALKSQKQKMSKTGSLEPSQKFNATQKVFTKTGGQPSVSREYLQNQIMFNYKEMQQLKKKQKKEYLNQVQKKIAEAEQVVAEIALLQEQEKSEIDKINTFYETQKNKAMKKAETRKNQENLKTQSRFDEVKQFMRQLQQNQDYLPNYKR